MRVNIYAEEMTDRVEIVEKETLDGKFTGVRFFLYMPVSIGEGGIVKGPFIHRRFDDDSSAITFWGKKDLRVMLVRALELLDNPHVYDVASNFQNLTAAEPERAEDE